MSPYNNENNKTSGNLHLFSYLKNRTFVKSLKIMLGQFVAESIEWYSPSGFIQTGDFINKLNRILLAYEFLENRPDVKEIYNLKKSFNREDPFLQDIAQYIDFKIPLYYWVSIQKFLYGNLLTHYDFKSSYSGIKTIPELIFTYSCNYDLEPAILGSKIIPVKRL